MSDSSMGLAPVSTREHEGKRPPRAASFRALFPFFRPYRWQIALASLALLITAGVSLALPVAVRRVIDHFGTQDPQLLNGYFAIAVGIGLVFSLGTALRYSLVTILGERIVADIRLAVYNRMIAMSPAYFEKLMTGEVLSRITTDTTLILSVVGSSVSWFVRNALLLIGGLCLMLWTSVKLTGLVILIIPIVLLPILSLGRRLRRLSKENQDWIAAASAKASEDMLSVQVVQAFTQEAHSQNAFMRMTEGAFVSSRARILLRGFITAIIIFFVLSGIIGVLWIGATDVRLGVMSAGELVQFLIYAAFVASAAATMSELWAELQRVAGASERLAELLEAKDDIVDPEQPLPLGMGAITFEDVKFSFPSRPSQLALAGISFEVHPGETVAVVGPSGAGKSTLLQLLLRFFDPASGVIRLAGTDIRQAQRSDLRTLMALVPQEPVIFAASVAENIRYGRPEASMEEVRQAASMAAADEFIDKLPEMYETFVGERGVMLSGGQKQRIAIARAILRDAPILLLDEATSALDASSEAAVQTAIDALLVGKTTIVIAHRLATVKKADKIIVLQDGQIVAQGKHEELVQENGLYARLARLQFTAGRG